MSPLFIINDTKLVFNYTIYLLHCKGSQQERKLGAKTYLEMSTGNNGILAICENVLKFQVIVGYCQIFPSYCRFRRAIFAMFKCQTHQALPVTTFLPMDVPQNPLTSGRI